MYHSHPSGLLNEAFVEKPYQGASPLEATFLFIGLDANYAPNIENMPIFGQLLEYHADGVAFWRKYGVHHPFLLPGYQGDGSFYHRSFSRIGFTPAHAAQVSFIELLHLPTAGRNKVDQDDFSDRHLQFLESAILKGKARHVFIPAGVARTLRPTAHGSWLPKTPERGGGPLAIWCRKGEVTVYRHLHFSVYGKFEQQKVQEIRKYRKSQQSERWSQKLANQAFQSTPGNGGGATRLARRRRD